MAKPRTLSGSSFSTTTKKKKKKKKTTTMVTAAEATVARVVVSAAVSAAAEEEERAAASGGTTTTGTKQKKKESTTTASPRLNTTTTDNNDKTQQEQEQQEQEQELILPMKKRPRRSNRDTNRIVLSDRSCLQYRRLEELFFRDEEDCSSSTKVRAETTTAKKRTTTTEQDDESAAADGADADADAAAVLQLGNFKLRKVHSSPNIYVVENFLSCSELEHLRNRIDKGRPRFRRSFVDSGGTLNATEYDDEHRTSAFVSFEKQQDAGISAVERRAAELLGCWSTQSIEPLQLVRYKPGQFFGVHHDMGDYDETTGRVTLPAKTACYKRRLVTLFCYVKQADAGGATVFPACGNLRVSCQAGNAVLFSNVLAVTGQPDARTIHAGEKVERGIKYGLNIWLCED